MMTSSDINTCESEGLGEIGKMQQWYLVEKLQQLVTRAMKHTLEHLKIVRGNFEMKGSPYFKKYQSLLMYYVVCPLVEGNKTKLVNRDRIL